LIRRALVAPPALDPHDRRIKITTPEHGGAGAEARPDRGMIQRKRHEVLDA